MATLRNWSESLPSDDSLVVKAPGYTRSIWRDITTGLSESLFWPGSGGGSVASQGELRPGATKTWFAPESDNSYEASATHRSRMFFASDTSRLFIHNASTTTRFYGSPFFSEHATYFEGATWQERTGSYTTNTGGTGLTRSGTVNIVGIAYAGVPLVFTYTNNTDVFVAADAGGLGSFTTQFRSFVSGAAGATTVRWTSLGTVNT